MAWSDSSWSARVASASGPQARHDVQLFVLVMRRGGDIEVARDVCRRLAGLLIRAMGSGVWA